MCWRARTIGANESSEIAAKDAPMQPVNENNLSKINLSLICICRPMLNYVIHLSSVIGYLLSSVYMNGNHQ